MARVFISHSSRDNEAATRIKNWLHEQGFDTPFLDFDKHAGIAPGADWERTLYREIEQSEAVVIIQTAHWMESKWCFAEFTQARALGKAIFPIIETPHGEALISPDIQALDLRKDHEGGLERLATQLTQIALDAQGGFAWDAGRPPYPGLLAFQEEDAALYFGRDDDIRRLIERLNARRAQGGARLVALLGASGSGKSSLLRAGVIPRLKRAGKHWIVVPPLRPQSHPVDELARALAVARGPDTDLPQLQTRLLSANPAEVLRQLANELRVRAGMNEAQILLPIDQAEELFGAAEPAQANRFLDILSVALSGELPFMAVAAMRSDYLGQLQSAEHLRARFEEFSLAPMPLTRIAQIIQGPARVAGLRVDDDFVQQAARDAETEDALPLLAFALRELYDSAGGDKHLSLSEYQALGDRQAGLTPLENAVRRAADGVLADARPDELELAALREAFVPAMVRVNDQGDYVRRPARWDELPAKAHPLLERLAKARLLIVSQDGGARSVEVAHEALLRKWPLLRAWLDDAREFLVGSQQLERDLLDWQRAAQADRHDALLSGLKLTRARAWLAERPQQLKPDVRAFVQASMQQADADAARRLRLRRNTRLAIGASAVVLAGAAAFVGYKDLEGKRKQLEADLQGERLRKAAEVATAGLDESRKAAQQRAIETIGFVWVDLGAKRDEVARLTQVANELKADPSALLPSAIKQQPDGYDCKTYLEEGLRYLYCSVRSIVSFSRLRSISGGLDIFRPGGPHQSEVNLSSEYSFGHYNPEFLDWLEKYLIPAERNDARFNAITRQVYAAYIGPTVRALHDSHKILYADPQATAAFMARYEQVGRDYRGRLERRETNESRFASGVVPKTLEAVKAGYLKRIEGRLTKENGYELQEDFRWLADYLATEKGHGWYWGGVSGGFWVRRSIDGTDAQMFRLVTKLLQTFEPSVLGKR